MSHDTTLTAFLIFLALLALASWQSRREHPPGRMPLIPWTALQFLALTACVLLLAHLISLWTGQPLLGRRG